MDGCNAAPESALSRACRDKALRGNDCGYFAAAYRSATLSQLTTFHQAFR